MALPGLRASVWRTALNVHGTANALGCVAAPAVRGVYVCAGSVAPGSEGRGAKATSATAIAMVHIYTHAGVHVPIYSASGRRTRCMHAEMPLYASRT